MFTKEKRIFLSPPWMGGEEFKLMKRAYDSGYIAPCGIMVCELEKKVEAFTGIPYATAVNGGTAALTLIYHELGIKKGDIVFCSDLTFIASIGPAIHRGAKPVFIDSDEKSWTMDPELLEAALADAKKRGKLPKCVTVTDLYGQCADYDTLGGICDEYGVPMIVDSAEALGATYKGRSAGSAGIAGIFSFNGNKIITTSGGGMLVSRNGALIERANKRSQQCREKCAWYEHNEVGYNMRMSNISAAIGVGQMHYINNIIRRKRMIFSMYSRALSDIAVGMPEVKTGKCTRWLSVFLLKPGELDKVMKRMTFHNIEARPIWKPMHLQPCFKGCKHFGGKVGEKLFETGICLPSGAGLTEKDLNRVIDAVRNN